ncbi:unnamed protein product [Mucor circinelloides]|uniref:PWWP domain-containing protein n=1 Tax=Mucor circinelloides f. circinelloides (strain 1006PhL) TaxID=1220926 RepID=S2J4M4_MUCC1|nr:hypothetical protein HMPREF1544_10204 [Mucor circinelloides 1006PhL]
MRQQGRTEYLPGTTVFAKLKGYPWWPARIEVDSNVPAKVLKQKSKTKNALYTVFFYGSRDYGFFGPDAIRPFDNAMVENDLKAKKFKTKDLELAVRQALNPSLLTQLEEENNEDEDDDEEEEEAEDDEEDIKKGKSRKTSTAANKKKPVANGKTSKKKATPVETTTAQKRKSRKLAMGDEEDAVGDTAVGDSVDRKRRRKSMSLEKEEGHESPIAHDLSKDDIKKSPEYKKVYHIRHRLQRLVYNKKEGEIPLDDYPKILQVVKEIEEAPMTYNLLKDTKIGKVVKAACSYPFENDTAIKDRCQHLMRSWKTLFIDPQQHSKLKTQEDTHMQDV